MAAFVINLIVGVILLNNIVIIIAMALVSPILPEVLPKNIFNISTSSPCLARTRGVAELMASRFEAGIY